MPHVDDMLIHPQYTPNTPPPPPDWQVQLWVLLAASFLFCASHSSTFFMPFFEVTVFPSPHNWQCYLLLLLCLLPADLICCQIKISAQLSFIFLEAKSGAPTRISEAKFRAKPPDLLIWEYPSGSDPLIEYY